MKYDNPKLTAFVLGELSESDAKEIQTAIDADPELQREVNDIRQTAQQLKEYLNEEPLLAGTPRTPAQIDLPLKKPKRRFTLIGPLVVVLILGTLAAGLLMPARHRAIEVAQFDSLADEKHSPVPMPSTSAEVADVRPATVESRRRGDENRAYNPPEMERASAPMSHTVTVPGEGKVLMGGIPIRSESPANSNRGVAGRPGIVPQEARSLQLMVTPRVLIQEEEEECAEYRLKGIHDPYDSPTNTHFSAFKENEFLRPQDAPFSTFSVDVDTASYSVARRYLMERNQRPPADSVRLEEFINYFDYHYAPPTDGKPFATYVDVATCPWNSSHLLARVALKGKEIPQDDRPPLNLVFLIDVSGSMSGSNRLPLVKDALVELTKMITERDRVGIVTYAGDTRVALPSVSGREKQAINDSIASLSAGGSTNGAGGIQAAYELAEKNFTKNGQNRVILCTDGDFNVGISDNASLQRLIEERAKSGVFLTVLGFGMGNHNDAMLKILSTKGNGNYGYIDTIEEAKKLLVEGLAGTLITIAKDVKIQIDFNPNRVAAYRLLGYENRKLRDEDFHNDRVDAGEIGAGHSVTALYEIVPVGVAVPGSVDQSRYAVNNENENPETARSTAASPVPYGDELMFVKLRYKAPDGNKSELLETPVAAKPEAMSSDFEFAAAVALFGMLLRDSRYSGDGNWDTVLELAQSGLSGAGDDNYREELIELVKRSSSVR
ncbi:MAG: von Willebrand factor type A domain-containing protein [Planctomycetaceae bacterium]|nr:von Willebrand factor type A domain-containing protein [Planctomycetaceae bacterium]